MSDTYSNTLFRPNVARHGQRWQRHRTLRPLEERMQDPTPGVAEQARAEYQRRAAQTDYAPVYGPGAVLGVGSSTVRPSSTSAPLTAERDQAAAAPVARPIGSQVNTRHTGQFTYAPGAATRQAQIPDELQTNLGPDFPVGPGGVVSTPPEERAARAVGVPVEYLRSLTGQESGGSDAGARAKSATSSATGSTQFTDSTWLSMFARYGALYGGRDLADHVHRERNGSYKVDTAAARREILDLRYDPTWSALMGAHYARDNAADLSARLGGRDVREGEVYLAHFLGSETAARLIRAASRETHGAGVSGVSVVGVSAAQANPRIFYEGGRYHREPNASGRGTHEVYDGGGRERSARDVVRLQTRGFRRNVFEAANQAPTGGRSGARQ